MLYSPFNIKEVYIMKKDVSSEPTSAEKEFALESIISSAIQLPQRDPDPTQRGAHGGGLPEDVPARGYGHRRGIVRQARDLGGQTVADQLRKLSYIHGFSCRKMKKVIACSSLLLYNRTSRMYYLGEY